LEDWGNGVEPNVIPASYDRFLGVSGRVVATGRLPRSLGRRPRIAIRVRRYRARGTRPPVRFPDEQSPPRSAGAGLTIVFTDLELIPDDAMGEIYRLWDSLAASSHDIRLLNDPRTPKKRIPLLELYYREGVNEFATYRIADEGAPRPRQFPVFVREANNHLGPASDLIGDQASLDAWVADARSAGRLSTTPIVTEFVDTKDADGRFRKYGAFRIGDSIVAAHVHVADSWAVKIRNSAPDAAFVQEEWDYISNNPHEAQVRRAFELAKTEYGRMDYSLRDGRIQVFEINTSPTLLGPGNSNIAERTRRKEYVARGLHRAFVALGSPA